MKDIKVNDGKHTTSKPTAINSPIVGRGIRIPQYEPYLDGRELQYLADCIETNWITGGLKVKEFESRMAKLTGAKHAIACCNGTMALYIGLKIMGIGAGDKVIVPDFTFIASANSVVMTGAEPVFCDVDIDSFCMNEETIKKVITPTVSVIMPVGIYGNSPDMREVCSIAVAYGLKIIEDAAQDIAVTWGGKCLGTFGDVGCMSFYSDKTICCGEGGMIFTDSDEMAKKAIMLMNQGRLKRGWYVHETIGYNFRLTDLGAAVGLAQLDKLPEIIEKKRIHEELYRNLLVDIKQIEFPKIDKRCFNVPFRHNVLVPDPEALSKYLAGLGIGNLRFFYPLHRQPCYKYLGYDDSMFPNTIKAYDRGLSLPSSVKLTDGEIFYICAEIRKFYKGG